MVNYQNGKIYKIINENNEIIYIGSTAEQHLSQRYTRHKHKAPNHKIILIENYPCNSREELCMREQQVIEEHSNLLNKIKAYCSEEEKIEYFKEYRKNNKEYYTQIYKEHYENNKDIILQKQKEYYEDNKNIILQKAKEYRVKNKEYIKQFKKKYRENNKEYFKQYKKEYYEKNKNELNEKRQVKVKCEFCNCEIQKNNLKRHQKTSKKCLKFQNL